MKLFVHTRFVVSSQAFALIIASAAPAALAQALDLPPEPATLAGSIGADGLQQPDLEGLLPTDGTETIRERYPSGAVRIERQVTLDEERNYVNHGPWKMFDQQGGVIAEGQFAMGRRTGVWTRWHSRNGSELLSTFPFNRFQAPFVSTASFTDGVMDGHWMVVDSQDRKVLQVSIKDGERDGLMITWAPNGAIMRQASYKQGVPVGDVLEMNNNAKEPQRVASYVDGRKVVNKVGRNRRNSNLKEIEELYLAPKTVQKTPDSFWDLKLADYELVGEEMRHGPSKAWYANGQLKSQGQYRYGEKVGKFTYWHENGQKLAEGEYSDDSYDGRWTWWHENGQKSAIGEYAMGDQTGTWLWWHADGRLLKQGIVDSGRDKKVRSAAQPLEIEPRR